MRILHTTSSPVLSGGEKTTLYLADWLGRRGHDVVLVVPADGSLLQAARRRAVETKVVPMRPLVRGLHQFRRVLTEWKPDVVHSHGVRDALLSRLTFWTEERVALVSTYQGLPDYEWVPISNVRRVVYGWCDTATARRCDRAVVVSESLRDDLAAKRQRRFRAVELVPNGEDFEWLANAASDPLPPQVAGLISRVRCVFAFIGRLHAQKNVQLFIDAALEAGSGDSMLGFVIVGDGPLRRELEQKVSNTAVSDRVVFAGRLANPLPVLRRVHGLVLTSHWEGHPWVIIEAGGLGVPVVGSAVPGIQDCIEDGETGLLFPDGDAGACARRMLQIAEDPQVASRLGENLKRFAVKYWSVEEMVESHERMYTAAVTERRYRS